MAFEVRSDGRHVVERVVTSQAAVHALTLLQTGIRDLHRGLQWIVWIGGEGLESQRNGRSRKTGCADQVDGAERQCARNPTEAVVQEHPADVILLRQECDDLFGGVDVVVRNINKVGTAIGRDNHFRIRVVQNVSRATDQSVSVRWMLANCGGLLRNGGIHGLINIARTARDNTVRIEEGKVQGVGQINRHETDGQKTCINFLPASCVLVYKTGRIAGRCSPVRSHIVLADGGKTVVGGYEYVGVRCEIGIAVDVVQNLLQVVIRIVDPSLGGWSVDTRNQGIQTVSLVMLSAIGIARPVDQDERVATGLESRQNGLGGGVGKILLLSCIRHKRSRSGVVARRLYPQRSYQRQTRIRQCGDRAGRQWYAIRSSGCVVDENCDRRRKCLADRVQLSDVLNGDGADFSDRGRVIAVGACHLQQRLLGQVIAVVVVIEVRQNRVIFDEGRVRPRSAAEIAGVEYGISRINRVAEVASVAEVVAGGDSGTVGSCESRKQRMAVYEINSLVTHT